MSNSSGLHHHAAVSISGVMMLQSTWSINAHKMRCCFAFCGCMQCFGGRFEPRMYIDTTATLSSQAMSNDKQQICC